MARIRALKDYKVLDTLPERLFDNLTLLASQIAGTPIALVSLVDENRQWFKSRVGLDASETSREVSFCGHAIHESRGIFEIPDSTKDPRFADNPLVTGNPRVIFYAGAPLRTPSGENIGTLCVIDNKPNKLTPTQIASLEALAEQVVALMELRIASESVVTEKLKLQSMFDSTSIGMALVRGPGLVFEKVNQQFTSLVGKREYHHRQWVDVYPELPNSPLPEIMKGVFETGNSVSFSEEPLRVRIDSGELEDRFYNITYSRVDDIHDQPYGILIQTTDVSSAVYSRKHLADANDRIATDRIRLTSSLNELPVGIAFFEGPNHVYTFTNKEHDKLLGDRRDLLGRPVAEAVPDTVESGVVALLDHVYKTGEPYSAEGQPIAFEQPDGTRKSFYINFAYQPLRDFNDRIYGIIATVSDVTEQTASRLLARQNTERALKAERQLKDAVEVAKVGFYDWDVQKDEITMSEQFQKDWGTQPGATLGEVLELIVPEDREPTRLMIESALGSGQNFLAQYRILRPSDGKLIWIEAQWAVTFLDDGKPARFFGTSIDITDRKVAEMETVEAKLEAERANSAKSAFLANMSHEIRSPLGAIMGFSDLLKDPDNSKEDAANYVSVIDRNANHLLRIIDDILDLSKVEAGKMLFESIDFSLLDLLADFSSLMGLRARDKGIAFEMRLDSAIPETVKSDPTRLRQILTNVVGNAIKFTERGFVKLNIGYLDELLVFTVEDTGVGISAEHGEALFQPFHQADVSTTRKFGGTGLGLALTRRLSEAMGGGFELTNSVLGQGSLFTVSIKPDLADEVRFIDRKDFAFLGAAPRISPKSGKVLEGMHVLLVEDSPDNQVLLNLILSNLGATVTNANDGQEGVDKALALDFDIVLCDIQMPLKDGYEAARELRQRGYKKPIVAISAHAMKDQRERAIEAGFTDFLSKPVNRDALASVLSGLRLLPN